MRNLKLSLILILFTVPNFVFGTNTSNPISDATKNPIDNYTNVPDTTYTTSTPKPTNGPTIDNAKQLEETQKRDQDPNNIAGSNFELKVNELTPAGDKYKFGAKSNITSFLKKITNFLLIVIPSFAVLFMVVGAIKIILAGGDSGKVGTGKTIIQFNIIAVVLALSSYAIINLVVWLVGSSL